MSPFCYLLTAFKVHTPFRLFVPHLGKLIKKKTTQVLTFAASERVKPCV